MDKKLLDALNNLSFAFEELAKALGDASKDKDKAATSAALTQGKLEKKIELIDKGIKKLQADNKKILKNQEQLLKLAKSKSEKGSGGPAEEAAAPMKKNKVKDGLATIMLIAVGVLAIGLAFKIIGKVNFASVIALSIALPIIAYAFEKIAASENLKPGKMKSVVIVLTMMSIAIALSSFILSLVKPVGIVKLFTATIIAAAFTVIAYSLPKMAEAFSMMSTVGVGKFILFGPLILLAVSIAIVYSSQILQMVKPVGFFKLFTSIMIAAAFVGISYSLPRLAKGMAEVPTMGVFKFILFGPAVLLAMSVAIALSSRVLGFVKPVGFFKLFTAIMISAAFAAIGWGLGRIVEGLSKAKLDPARAALVGLIIPVVFIAMAIAIAASSRIFQFIKPVGLFKLITAALIGLVFIPLSYALPRIAKAVGDIKVQKALLIPVVLVLLAVAIMVTSYLFDMTLFIPFGKLLNILFQAGIISALGLAMSFVIPKLAKLKPSDVIKGAVIILALALTLMLTSLILSVGSYKNFPSAAWAFGVGLSIIFFAPAVVLLGLLAMADGGISQLLGAVMVLVLALAIVGVSHILAAGKYDAYPPLKWTASVVLAMVPFAIMTVVLGAIAMTGIGLIAFGLGIPMVLTVADTIVQVSQVLSKGKFDTPNIFQWALATALLYTTFVPILLVLGAVSIANSVASFFGANPWESARVMIVQIAETIVEVAGVLSKGNFTGGPSIEWASGVYIALGAFAPVYAMLVANKIFELMGGGGVGPKEFSEAIAVVVSGIVFAAEAFDSFKEKKAPSKEWAEGVGLAIGAFAPVYAMLVRDQVMKAIGTGGGVGPEDFSRAIMVVCRGILDAAHFFGENIAAFDLSKIPKKEWGEAVGGAIKAFMPALDFITKNASWWSGADPDIIKKAIKATAEGITDSSLILADGDYTKTIPKDWVTSTSEGIRGFIDLAMWLNDQSGSRAAKNYFKEISEGIRDSSLILAKGEYKDTITQEWTDTIYWCTKDYVSLVMWVNEQTGLSKSMGYFSQVRKSMIDTSFDFRKMSDNARNLDENWMKGVTKNILRYINLARWLAKTEYSTSYIDVAVWGMRNLSRSYSDLAYSISKLNDSLEDLDLEKLNALKSLNATVVLISAMDSDNFRDMMSELESKAGELMSAFEKIDEQSKSSDKGKAPSPQIKGSGGGKTTAERTISDLCSIMESVDSKLDSIARSSDKMSKYVDEIRGGDPLLRKR